MTGYASWACQADRHRDCPNPDVCGCPHHREAPRVVPDPRAAIPPLRLGSGTPTCEQSTVPTPHTGVASDGSGRSLADACSQLLDALLETLGRLGETLLDWMAGIPTVRFADPDEPIASGWPVDLAAFGLATAPGSSPGSAGAADIGPQVGDTRADLPQAPTFERPAYCAYRDVPEHRCVDAFGLESSVDCWATDWLLRSMAVHPTNKRGVK